MQQLKQLIIQVLLKQKNGYEIEVFIDYSNLEKFQYYLNKNNISITNIDYNEIIKCRVEVTEEEKEEFINSIKKDILKIEKYNIISTKNIKKLLTNE